MRFGETTFGLTTAEGYQVRIKRNQIEIRIVEKAICLSVALVMLLAGSAFGELGTIDGITGPVFELEAKEGWISTAEGGQVYMWGYGEAGKGMQFPGPTLLVKQNQTVTISLTNQGLVENVSIVFPGQQSVTPTCVTGGCVDGLMAKEAPDGETVKYSFVAARPGTYTYYSGTHMDLQVEMGLRGTLIVYPEGIGEIPPTPDDGPHHAYEHANSAYELEYLQMVSEVDPLIHYQVENGDIEEVNMTTRKPKYWFINGRTLPDTLFFSNVGWMPTQPYSSLVLAEPGRTLLVRVVGGGLDEQPQHYHGENFRIIARDGRIRESAPGKGPDIGLSRNTLEIQPGQTYDFTWNWLGQEMGWDIYGHGEAEDCDPSNEDQLEDFEDPNDHCKNVPVTLPEQQFVMIGGLWSGSFYMGQEGNLPPGEGGLNPWAGFAFPWHNHHEVTLANFDIFPGGMFTMAIVVPGGTLGLPSP